jgi:hypothetical protein
VYVRTESSTISVERSDNWINWNNLIFWSPRGMVRNIPDEINDLPNLKILSLCGYLHVIKYPGEDGTRIPLALISLDLHDSHPQNDVQS